MAGTDRQPGSSPRAPSRSGAPGGSGWRGKGGQLRAHERRWVATRGQD